MAAVSLDLSSSILQTITHGDWTGTGLRGFLVGELDGRNPRSVTAAWQSSISESSDLKEDIDDCLSHFPAGQQVVGLVIIPRNAKAAKSILDKDQAGIDREFEEILGAFDTWLDQMDLAHLLCLCLGQDTPPTGQFHSSLFTITEEGISEAEIRSDDNKARSKLRMRLRADVPLVISAESNTEEQLKPVLEQELLRLHNQTGSFVFGFLDNSVLLHQSGVMVGAAGEAWSTCRDIHRHWLEEEGLAVPGTGSKKKASGTSVQTIPVPVSLLRLATAESSLSHQYAPIIRHRTGAIKTSNLTLPLDVLVEVEEKTSVANLALALVSSLSRQLLALFGCLKLQTKKGNLSNPEVFHFQLSQLDTPLTVVYPQGFTDEALEPERKSLHKKLCLPPSVPLLRRGCAGHFLSPTAPAGYLMNPHLGLPEPPVKGASTCVVQGYYSYHHYMQDRFNDDKWGCAYRSLQSICSWFKYQGYTTRDVPSHREIQQALCDIGDKEQKFVGSRQWIGSFEVSFVLDHLLGVTSKFINVNCGAELSTIGQQLMEHFHSQGTPVMIGGGVLAHTILGVAYSELTGDISFLILDPHYTGGEDLRVIQDKGWCGWKDMTFWNQTAHYNLCLPQRPSTSV